MFEQVLPNPGLVYECFDVKISMMSPVLIYNPASPFSRLLLPIVLFPISEWTRYAKSIGTDPSGNSITSPFGVKTNTMSENKSILMTP